MVAGIVVLSAITIVFKGAGALLPTIPDAIAKRLGGVAPALLAALVLTELTGDAAIPRVDAKVAGVVVAVVLAWRKAPFAVCVVAGAATAALLRAATG